MPVIAKKQCPQCASNGNDTSEDNLIVFEEGLPNCLACGYVENKWNNTPIMKEEKITNSQELIQGTITDIKSRGISKKTCEFMDYQLGYYTGYIEGDYCTNVKVQIANYYSDSGQLIKQKLRTQDKKFIWLGKGETGLYGQWKWPTGSANFVTCVEGEADALAVLETQSHRFPVVSISMGAGGARKELSKEHVFKWLNGFKSIILAFDNDDAGRKATEECLTLFDIDKVKIATWPQKDAGDIVKDSTKSHDQKKNEITNVLFSAKCIIPQQIVTVEDIMDRIMTRPEKGIPYNWKSLNNITMGFKRNQLSIWVAAEGTGKTEVVRQLAYELYNKGINTGILSFEEPAEVVYHRMAGYALNNPRIHMNLDEDWVGNEDKIKAEINKFNEKIYVFDNKYGINNKEQVISWIKYLAKVRDCKLIIIDNIKGLCSGMVNENMELRQYMLDFQQLKNSLDIHIFLVSHLGKHALSLNAYVSSSPKNPSEYLNRTAEDMNKYINKPGMSWESGRMPQSQQVEGTNSVTALADNVFGIARNKVSTDKTEQRIMRVKCLKTRTWGGDVGSVFKLYYNDDGKYEEIL